VLGPDSFFVSLFECVLGSCNYIDIIILLSGLVQEEFDTYDHNAHLFVKLQFLRRRSKIIEIVQQRISYLPWLILVFVLLSTE